MTRVISDPCEGRYTESSFVRVHTYPKRRERDTTLATIEHVAAGDPGGRESRTLLDGEPMSHEDAMHIAYSYCDQYGVPVIYERRDEGDFTDTVVMPA